MSADANGASIEELQRLVREFVAEREWEKFHSPRNLASAIAVEAGELLGHFRWLSDTDSAHYVHDEAKRAAVAAELADVMILSLEMASVLRVDVGGVVRSKLAEIAGKYPAERSRGRADKYTEYRPGTGSNG